MKTDKQIAAAPYATLTQDEKARLRLMDGSFVAECRAEAGRPILHSAAAQAAASRMAAQVFKNRK